jgi:hypothetical protein
MATKDYMAGRQKYQRPQALLFADAPGVIVDGKIVPQGYELGSDYIGLDSNRFIILSDHNRDPIQFKINRIEQRQRTVNGKMRATHIADKLTLTVSWNRLPSRAYSVNPQFDSDTGDATAIGSQYTVDGGAGGVELLDWYESHYGSFYVYLAYDKYSEFNDGTRGHLAQYNQVVEMFISDFSYTVEKRGMSNHDFWNISMTLEEA